MTDATGTTLFVGTASYYARFRPPYPRALLDCLAASASDGDPRRLLDLGCGTGELAVPLAAVMSEVDAVDVEPDMLAYGRARAARAGARTIRWHHLAAENFTAEEHDYNLVTAGGSFHWMDRPLLARRLRRWLRPGGTFAVTGVNSTWNGTEPWQQVALTVIRAYLGQERRAGDGMFRGKAQRHEEILADAGYDVAEHLFPVRRGWTVDTFLGYMYSTSFASRAVLGKRADAFEADLRSALLAHNASGRYYETLRFHCILGRLP